eukprot:2453752-Alexandrium_andersonii.AAC.1
MYAASSRSKQPEAASRAPSPVGLPPLRTPPQKHLRCHGAGGTIFRVSGGEGAIAPLGEGAQEAA